MSNKSANLLKSRIVKQLNSAKKPSTATSLYAGIPSSERAIQHQRSSQYPRRAQSKYGDERTITYVSKQSDIPVNYHPWEPEYHKIITREKNIKSMTKDPYTSKTVFITHAMESVTTEKECCPVLLPARAVKIQEANIQLLPRRSAPTIVRYLRRNELMPSERLASRTSMKNPSLSQLQYRKPSISVMNISKMTDITPQLTIADRLLIRDKIRNDPSVIRRPPRRLLINISHDTIMPLTVYG